MDDFEAIRSRVAELRRPPPADPAACQEHTFKEDTGRCVHCNIHVYHAPALTRP